MTRKRSENPECPAHGKDSIVGGRELCDSVTVQVCNCVCLYQRMIWNEFAPLCRGRKVRKPLLYSSHLTMSTAEGGREELAVPPRVSASLDAVGAVGRAPEPQTGGALPRAPHPAPGLSGSFVHVGLFSVYK